MSNESRTRGEGSKQTFFKRETRYRCAKLFQASFFLTFFFLMQTKEYVFVSRNFLLLHKLKKLRRPNLCQLFTYAGPMSTLVEPNQMILAILIDQLQQGKAAFVSRNIVYLFVSKLCLRQAQQYLVPLYKLQNFVRLLNTCDSITLLLSDA